MSIKGFRDQSAMALINLISSQYHISISCQHIFSSFLDFFELFFLTAEKAVSSIFRVWGEFSGYCKKYAIMRSPQKSTG